MGEHDQVVTMDTTHTGGTGEYWQDKTGWVYEHKYSDNPIADNWYPAEPINWDGSTSNTPTITIEETEEKNKLPEGVEMKKLYNVYMIYGENRKQLVIKKKDDVIASDEEDAKIKSGLMKTISEEWDNDYLTFIVHEIGEVKVKEKPKEVKNV